MRRRALLLVLILVTSAVSQAEILYGFEYVGPPCYSRLVEFDIQNGQIMSSSYFPVLDVYLQSGAFDDDSGNLYSWDGYTDCLCSIDISTGMPTIIGGGGLVPGDVGMSSLAINPITNEMFVMSYSGNLYQVDKANGNRTFIGDTSSVSHVHGLAFSPDGVLYCSDTTRRNQSELFTIDTETAESSFVGIIRRDYVISLDFDMDGTLYGSDSGTDTFGIINTTNGEWTYVGSLEESVSGMAFAPIPEPTTILLFGIGSLILRRKRRIL